MTDKCKKRFQDCDTLRDRALQYIIKEMCKRVNCNYETFDFRQIVNYI